MTETPDKVESPLAEDVDSPLLSVSFKGCSLPYLVTDEPPRVLIAGAGIAGLFLGILLEEAGIPYEIFERAAEIKPTGKIAPTIHPGVLPVFEQLGLYKELLSFSKLTDKGTFYTDKMEVIVKMESVGQEE
ncbi:hypothetical protein BGZ91_008591 [Linnemannia elongata]|nr:hypothetical protein BGZ91_008591 [Linnemannia elongata]